MTERLPIHGLHQRAGKQHLSNLKNVNSGHAVEDMIKYKDSCLAGLLRTALDVQRLLAENLMSLKRVLFTASLPGVH